jgi:hypothetical protein
MEFLIKRDPEKRDRWETTGALLDRNDVSFGLLRTFDERGLTDIGVTIGHAKILLGRSLNAYIKECQ